MSKPMMMASVRAFGHTKYSFDDEDWEPNQYQVSLKLPLRNSLYLAKLN